LANQGNPIFRVALFFSLNLLRRCCPDGKLSGGIQQEDCKVLTRRGPVHVFGGGINGVTRRVSRKMDPTPDFAFLLGYSGLAEYASVNDQLSRIFKEHAP
jgi:hypothetical protein